MEQELAFFQARSKREEPKKLRRSNKVVEPNDPAPKRTSRGNKFSHTISGKRPDLGEANLRSGWESNVLRILKAFEIKYQYEPKTFFFPVKRGAKGYIPDVYLPATSEYIEVKGYLDRAGQLKLKRFKKYYPGEFSKLTMIISKSSRQANQFCEELGVPTVLHYEELSKAFKSYIPMWEGR